MLPYSRRPAKIDNKQVTTVTVINIINRFLCSSSYDKLKEKDMTVPVRKGVNNKFLLDTITPITWKDHKKLKELEAKLATGKEEAPFPYRAMTYSYFQSLLCVTLIAVPLWAAVVLLQGGITLLSLVLWGVFLLAIIIIPFIHANNERETGKLFRFTSTGRDIKWLSHEDLLSDIIYRDSMGYYLRNAYLTASEKDVPVLWREYDKFSKSFFEVAAITLHNKEEEDKHKSDKLKELYEVFRNSIRLADEEILKRDKAKIEAIKAVGGSTKVKPSKPVSRPSQNITSPIGVVKSPPTLQEEAVGGLDKNKDKK